MLKHKGTQLIKTKRLTLRKFIENDSEKMFQNWANDDDVTKYLTWFTHKDINETKNIISDWIKYYNDEKWYQWAIVLDEINEPIGTISVVEFSEANNHCDIGYCIGKNFWNKGYTPEALKSVINFLIREVGFERVHALHHVENLASGKVMKKAGMKYEGRMRSFHKNKNGGYDDCNSYAIIKEDL